MPRKSFHKLRKSTRERKLDWKGSCKVWEEDLATKKVTAYCGRHAVRLSHPIPKKVTSGDKPAVPVKYSQSAKKRFIATHKQVSLITGPAKRIIGLKPDQPTGASLVDKVDTILRRERISKATREITEACNNI